MSIYGFKAKDKDGIGIQLANYEGKVVLIVNTATQCGFTPQYDGLQDLYEKYSDQGFVILDFPCNQFGNQAPGTDEEIHTFCDSHYGITFPRFSKIEVNGEDAHPLYQYLVKEKGFGGFYEEHNLTPVLHDMLSKEDPNYMRSPSIKWNFTKFLVDRSGHVVERFEPTDDLFVLESKIKELLALQ